MVVSIRISYTALLLPPLLFIIAFFYAPLAYIALFSAGEGGFISPYLEIISKPQYFIVIVNSFVTASAVAVIVMTLSIPPGYYLALESGGRERLLLLAFFTAPFIVDVLLRTLSLKILLGLLGVGPGRLSTALGLVYVNLPLGIIFSYAGFRLVPRNLVDAARTLGAASLESHLRVTLPLAAPWIAAGSVVVFLISFTDYVVPSLLGGTTGYTVGTLIYYLILSGDRWDLGSSLAILVSLASMCVAYTMMKKGFSGSGV